MKNIIIATGLILMLALAPVFSQQSTKKTLVGTSTPQTETKKVEPTKKTLPATTTVTKTTATKAKPGQKPIKGTVVNFSDLVMGGKGTVTKADAEKLAEKGYPIVFQSGKKIYFVYNSDGSFASRNLAKFASSKFVGIIGKVKKVSGFNVIIADKIESME